MDKFQFMPTKAPQRVYDMHAETAKFLRGIVLIEGGVVQDPLRTFMNNVPRVRNEKVVQPTGMPPADWSIA